MTEQRFRGRRSIGLMPSSRAMLLAGVAAAALAVSASRAAEPLPALNAQINETSVSGLSSGGYMAVQVHVVHASIMRGAGVLAAGPYGCAAGQMAEALGTCMTGTPDGAALARAVPVLAQQKLVDDPGHLARQRVWLFSGSRDEVVRRSVVEQLAVFYRQFIPAERIVVQNAIAAGHAFPTPAGDSACRDSGGTFIADCAYDAAGDLLQHVYGRLQPPPAGDPDGRLLAFDQRPYVPVSSSTRRAGLADEGYLFVPTRCAQGAACRIHVAFHGCRQNADTVGRAFIERAGYNRWAAINHIVVLYPQTTTTWAAPFNPKGCWDWWGYTGPEYATRNGLQIRAVRAMLDRLSSGNRPAVVSGR